MLAAPSAANCLSRRFGRRDALKRQLGRQKQTVLSSSSRAQKNQTQSSGAGSPVIARMAFALDSGLGGQWPSRGQSDAVQVLKQPKAKTEVYT